MMNRGKLTVAEWIDRLAVAFDAAGVHFGHGTDNARDEAAWLILHVLGAPLGGTFQDWGREVGEVAAERIQRLAEERCSSGAPLAYLLGLAWFCGYGFEVTRDVLVPRSPIAELILDGFRPWVEPHKVRRVLDLCTGSGCIGIATALQLGQARVDASDISAAALEVAARNVARHGVEDRVRLLQSDLFESIPAGRYDLIIANPPYVASGSMRDLPREYQAEPNLGLVAGDDGLSLVLKILVEAPRFMTPDGILVCEVGESEHRLAAALPGVPFLWLEFERGGSGVFVLDRSQLAAAQPALNALLRNRKDVV